MGQKLNGTIHAVSWSLSFFYLYLMPMALYTYWKSFLFSLRRIFLSTFHIQYYYVSRFYDPKLNGYEYKKKRKKDMSDVTSKHKKGVT